MEDTILREALEKIYKIAEWETYRKPCYECKPIFAEITRIARDAANLGGD